MKCEECGADSRKVGEWAAIWIMACKRCPATWLWIRYGPRCEGG